VGAGPAGLTAAEVLAGGGRDVLLFDRMPSAGRKLLLAGRGGLNLTHGEPLDVLLARYGAATPCLRSAIEAFPPEKLRAWCEALGQPTFVGSSGRVFPVALKASPLLRAWLRRLDGLGVAFRPRHLWTGWDDAGAMTFAAPDGPVAVRADATVLALGGASWPRLGSDGGWVDLIARAGIAVGALRPANCGFAVSWSAPFRDRFEGQPLKRVALSFGDRTARGEAIITRYGLEGGAIYALSGSLRDAIAATGEAELRIDLRPDLSEPELTERLAVARGKQSFSTFLRKRLSLAPPAIGLINEAAAGSSIRASALPPPALAALIKSLRLRLIGVAPIDRAISSAGGIAFDEIDESFMLKRKPGVFVAGEMLDWEAPTGGYLLQASFATGAAAARGALAWLARNAGG
jgi:uncharacterized flavoprotein (TIGR03862 family)